MYHPRRSYIRAPVSNGRRECGVRSAAVFGSGSVPHALQEVSSQLQARSKDSTEQHGV